MGGATENTFSHRLKFNAKLKLYWTSEIYYFISEQVIKISN